MFPILVSHKRFFFFFLNEQMKAEKKNWASFSHRRKLLKGPGSYHKHHTHGCLSAVLLLCCRSAVRTAGFPASLVLLLQAHWHLGQVHAQHRQRGHQPFIQITSITGVLSLEVIDTDILTSLSTVVDFNLLLQVPIFPCFPHFIYIFPTRPSCGFLSSPSGYPSLFKPD